jgi:hypothetical protein
MFRSKVFSVLFSEQMLLTETNEYINEGIDDRKSFDAIVIKEQELDCKADENYIPH